jgi:hypothetical protein
VQAQEFFKGCFSGKNSSKMTVKFKIQDDKIPKINRINLLVDNSRSNSSEK